MYKHTIKFQKGKLLNRITSKNATIFSLKFGCLGLKTLQYCKITSKQFETFYNAINKILKRAGQIHFNCFPQCGISKKPNEIRMGKGKGLVSDWVCKLKPGVIFVEIETQNMAKAIAALNYAKYRLPIKTTQLIIF